MKTLFTSILVTFCSLLTFAQTSIDLKLNPPLGTPIYYNNLMDMSMNMMGKKINTNMKYYSKAIYTKEATGFKVEITTDSLAMLMDTGDTTIAINSNNPETYEGSEQFESIADKAGKTTTLYLDANGKRIEDKNTEELDKDSKEFFKMMFGAIEPKTYKIGQTWKESLDQEVSGIKTKVTTTYKVTKFTDTDMQVESKNSVKVMGMGGDLTYILFIDKKTGLLKKLTTKDGVMVMMGMKIKSDMTINTNL